MEIEYALENLLRCYLFKYRIIVLRHTCYKQVEEFLKCFNKYFQRWNFYFQIFCFRNVFVCYVTQSCANIRNKGWKIYRENDLFLTGCPSFEFCFSILNILKILYLSLRLYVLFQLRFILWLPIILTKSFVLNKL